MLYSFVTIVYCCTVYVVTVANSDNMTVVSIVHCVRCITLPFLCIALWCICCVVCYYALNVLIILHISFYCAGFCIDRYYILEATTLHYLMYFYFLN